MYISSHGKNAGPTNILHQENMQYNSFYGESLENSYPYFSQSLDVSLPSDSHLNIKSLRHGKWWIFPLDAYTMKKNSFKLTLWERTEISIYHELIYLDAMVLCYRGYHYCNTSFIKASTQNICMFILLVVCVEDLRCWKSLTMVPAVKKVKRLLSVNHSTKNNLSTSQSKAACFPWIFHPMVFYTTVFSKKILE